MRRVAIAILFATSTAAAEPPLPPPATAAPGLTIPARTWFLQLNLEASLTVNKVFAPFSVAPDISYGVTDDFQLSLVHSGSALTGFRGASGNGLCVTGAAHGCPNQYADGGIEGLYSLSRGEVATAGEVGLLWSSTDPLELDLKLGLRTKVTSGRLFLLFSPSVWLPVSDPYDRVVPHDTQLWLPISGWIKATPAFALGLSSGFKGPPSHIGTQWTIPFGILGQYTVSPVFAIGASLVFGKVAGGSAVIDPGLDARSLHVWFNITP